MPPIANTYPIVVLGGGFAGAYCARALASYYQTKGPETVALLADNNFILFHPMLAEVSGSSISPADVVNPLRSFCRRAAIHFGSVTDVDFEAKTVRFSPGPFVEEVVLQFEHLVLALGSVTDVSRVPGMAEHGYLFKNVGDAIHLKTDVLHRLEEAESVTDEAIRKRLLTFMVVGGGYSGVETIGQLVDLVHGVRQFYPRLHPADVRFILAHSGKFLLPQIGVELGKYCEAHLRKRRVEVLLSSRVTAITAERAILNGTQAIETNTVVTTVGNAPNPVIQKLIARYQLANAHGRLTTEPTMRIPGWQNIWAAGDCAAVPDATGDPSPATAQFAMRQGTALGKNLIAVREKRAPASFRYRSMGEMASLGHRNAVGKVFGFKVSGLLGWLMWRATYLYKLPGLERKIKVFIEWNLELLFPRDISLLDVRPTEVLGRMHLEAGDPVFHRGDPAFSFYLIEKGSVAITDDQGEIRVLGQGQHFGERELLDSTRRQFDATAHESSTLLVLDRNTFEALTKNSYAIGYFLNRTSVRYTTPEERRSIVRRVPKEIGMKAISDFAHFSPAKLSESSVVRDALQIFHQANSSMLPVVDDSDKPQGWLRLDAAFDWLHLGKATLESKVGELLILPGEPIAATESVEAALLRFTQTPDRELLVVDQNGCLTGTLALLDLIMAAGTFRRPDRGDPLV
ncbi:MAG: FAD-dependent oxidoreductase [Verrucomicrobia bacterium]|nr:FAD-dependent oxidoreductase [Verrucomicrobiota bacterium]